MVRLEISPATQHSGNADSSRSRASLFSSETVRTGAGVARPASKEEGSVMHQFYILVKSCTSLLALRGDVALEALSHKGLFVTA